MTEEENKAIECLKIVVDDINECGAEYYIDKDILSDIQTALNLIKKLQKENEEKSGIYQQAKTEIENLREKTEKYYVLIYKIREKIKELEEEAEICRKEGCENTEDFDNCCVEILKELLEE